ncbi:hypothetical protein PRIPAC_91124 [Pristionchus pacificus]|uniref:Uncharacterized protein n=1 Tax=Pristionchus pacificus TaxID=54126 RepID=A0A2A6CWS2_PRIPA|nr:hypothetical protein PRIPAC_91124 [Pristionchus pacificus]|eukprot:PDM82672.1 hypothetical protein PRIPAC_37065 [Pristionchus pacificus]
MPFGCAQLGSVAGLTCTLPTREQFRTTENCPRIDPQGSVDSAYTQNPLIDVSYIILTSINTKQDQYHFHALHRKVFNSMPCGVGYNAIDLLMPDLSHKVVASAYYLNLAWDAELAASLVLPRQSRPPACFRLPLADARALDPAACAPLRTITDLLGYGPPTAPFNRTFVHRRYQLTGGSQQHMSKNDAWINCVYGSWLWLATYDGHKQTRGVAAANIV